MHEHRCSSAPKAGVQLVHRRLESSKTAFLDPERSPQLIDDSLELVDDAEEDRFESVQPRLERFVPVRVHAP